MMSNAICSTRRLAVLAIATSLLTACATAGSRPSSVTVCPPVVEYSREFQVRAADELVLLLERSAIAEMLNDYTVMREQARACEVSSRGSVSNFVSLSGERLEYWTVRHLIAGTFR